MRASSLARVCSATRTTSAISCAPSGTSLGAAIGSLVRLFSQPETFPFGAAAFQRSQVASSTRILCNGVAVMSLLRLEMGFRGRGQRADRRGRLPGEEPELVALRSLDPIPHVALADLGGQGGPRSAKSVLWRATYTGHA